MKIPRDKRPDHFKADVIKLKDKPMSPKQKKTLFGVLNQAHRKAKACFDERSLDTFRHEEIATATVDHRSGQVHGLTEARSSHFRAIMGHFLYLAGRHEEAYQMHLSDTPEGERKSLLLHLCAKELERLPPLNTQTPEVIHGQRQHYGNTICRRMFGCTMANAEVGQLDRLYRELKACIPRDAKVRTAARAHEARPVPEPQPLADASALVMSFHTRVPMGAELAKAEGF